MTQEINKTVLVVDDEDDVRLFLTTALIEAGFHVEQACDGLEALQQVNKKKPDLISLDLVMPKHSGVKFYHELTKNKEWASIPIIIVTGHARDDLGRADLKELTMSGPGIYLEKPVKPANYIAAIKKLLCVEVSPEEDEAAEAVAMQNELKNLVDEADPETLRKIKALLKGRG